MINSVFLTFKKMLLLSFNHWERFLRLLFIFFVSSSSDLLEYKSFAGLEKLCACSCSCMHHARKSSLMYTKKCVCKLFLSLNYFPIRNLSVLLHQNVFCSTRLTYIRWIHHIFWSTALNCLYIDMSHIFLTKQHVKILTLKDLKYLRRYHALHKLASPHINLLWEGRKSKRGYTYFLRNRK